ncbi:MAG: sensor histidine kinase, partial [Bacteroidota bacterium]
IYSILSLQERRLPDESSRLALNDARNRIHSMAALHRQLYEQKNFDQIDFEAYIEGMMDTIQDSMEKPETMVEIDWEIAPFHTDISRALSLGMILNELVSNVYKHAFKGRDRGHIMVRLAPLNDGEWQLSVQDNGVGLSKPIDWANVNSMGLLLVRQWVTKIRGQIDTQTDDGTTFLITFKS